MISNERVKHIFAGNGASKKFQIPFDFFKNQAGEFGKNCQITVIKTSTEGVETVLTEGADYEVETWDPSDSGSSGYSGYVILNTAPTYGEKLTIMRDVPLVQLLDLEAGKEIGPVELEAALDKVVMTLQQHAEKLQRAICYNPSTAQSDADAAKYMENLQTIFNEGTATVEEATKSAVGACEEYAATCRTKAAQTQEAFYDTVNRMTTAISSANQAVAAKDAAVAAKDEAVAAKNAAQSAQTGAQNAVSTLTGQVATHNEDATAHADIRRALAGKQDALPNGSNGQFLQKTENGVQWVNVQQGGGSSATVDSVLSDTSENPLQNKVIKAALDGKQGKLPDGATGLFLKKTADGVAWGQPSGGSGGSGSADWGSIGGTLADQTDLKNALDAKQDALSTAQLNAANSGVTAAKVSGYDTHVADSDIHVTAAQKSTWSGKQDVISDLSAIRTNAAAGKSAADAQATYGDVVTHDASEFQAAGSYASASHTHTKADITDLPSIPTKTSDLTNDSGFITDIPVANLTTPGKVKPDGTTITAAADGTLSAVGGGSSSSLTATYDSTNKVLTLR